MFDRIFAPALTFVMLIAGTAAIGSALFYEPRPEAALAQAAPAAMPLIVLDTVVVTGKRPGAERRVAVTGSPPAASRAAEGRGVLLHRPHD